MAWKCTNKEDLQDHLELYAFAVKGHSKEYTFASSSKDELNAWMNAFACLSDTEV